ncbi:hypothetical protein Bbelb_262000 [Branchiostoma belcheri]|nr:hypothetical protein Bbelb_262000 [Branchiostoma belcheri]
MGRVKKFSVDQAVEEKSGVKGSLLWWAVRVILVLIVIAFYNHHNHVEEENAALSERVQHLETELRQLKEHCFPKTTLDDTGGRKGPNDGYAVKTRKLEEGRSGEERRSGYTAFTDGFYATKDKPK